MFESCRAHREKAPHPGLSFVLEARRLAALTPTPRLNPPAFSVVKRPRPLFGTLRRYSGVVKQIWTGRVGQMAGKYGEHAPVVTTCCNACRTCVTTNVLTLVMGAGAAVGIWAARFIRGFSAKPS